VAEAGVAEAEVEAGGSHENISIIHNGLCNGEDNDASRKK
jgi:hypothetical protein